MERDITYLCVKCGIVGCYYTKHRNKYRLKCSKCSQDCETVVHVCEVLCESCIERIKNESKNNKAVPPSKAYYA